MQFKKGSFEVGGVIYPVAIKVILKIISKAVHKLIVYFFNFQKRIIHKKIWFGSGFSCSMN